MHHEHKGHPERETERAGVTGQRGADEIHGSG